jgi:hypothetical protein
MEIIMSLFRSVTEKMFHKYTLNKCPANNPRVNVSQMVRKDNKKCLSATSHQPKHSVKSSRSILKSTSRQSSHVRDSCDNFWIFLCSFGICLCIFKNNS